jgi:hypothetical protein
LLAFDPAEPWYDVVVVVDARLELPLPPLRAFLNSLSNNCNDRSKPKDRIDNTTIWIRATLATAAAIVKHNKQPITNRTNGSNITPPPGSIICVKKEGIVTNNILVRGDRGVGSEMHNTILLIGSASDNRKCIHHGQSVPCGPPVVRQKYTKYPPIQKKMIMTLATSAAEARSGSSGGILCHS